VTQADFRRNSPAYAALHRVVQLASPIPPVGCARSETRAARAQASQGDIRRMNLRPEDLESLYAQRFAPDTEHRHRLWKVLCTDFFQRYVPPNAVVLDVAAGHCEFINNIRAAERVAVDLNPDVVRRADPGVKAIVARADHMADIDSASVDRAFVSNFFEHVPRDTILSTLAEIRRVLRPDGKLLILQPNIRYCAKDYWMFFDHVTPVDDRALVEALRMSGYDVERCVPRFLPFTTKSRLPSWPVLVRLYVRMPLAWRFLGAQAFVVARPAEASAH
jgi:SAM-dependent methyltransferase